MSSVDLSSSAIDLEKVRSDASNSLIHALESRIGRKALVLDPRLGAPLMHLVNMNTLRQLDVDRLYYLEGGTLETTSSEIVFIVKPRLELMHKLAEVVMSVRDEIERSNAASRAGAGANIRSTLATKLRSMPNFSVFFVPRVSDACIEILKHLNVFQYIVISQLQINAVPIERDVFLVEHECAWRDLAVEKDTSCLFDIAQALHNVQKVCGESPLVTGKGSASKEVAEIMERLRREEYAQKELEADRWNGRRDDDNDVGSSTSSTASSDDASGVSYQEDSSPFSKTVTDWGIDFGNLPIGPERWRKKKTKNKIPGSFEVRTKHRPTATGPHTTLTPQIDMILLIDRDVDMVTPLCTQTTYEGLIDEVLGISGSHVVEFDDGEDEKFKKIKAKLDSNDPLFHELRDKNFGHACVELQRKSQAMQAEYRDMQDTRDDDESMGSMGNQSETKKKQSMSVSEIGGFVKKIKENVKGAGLDLHTCISKRLIDSTRGDQLWQRVRFAEVLDSERLCVEGNSVIAGVVQNSENFDAVYERLERMIFRESNVRRVARLLALVCLTFSGIPTKKFDSIRKEMVHAYGPPTVLLLQHMETSGLLFRREEVVGGALTSSSNTSQNQKNKNKHLVALKKRADGFVNTKGKLNLVVDDIDANAPNDIAYAYAHSGYAPISIRITLAAVKNEFKKFEDTLRLLPGPHFGYGQGFDVSDGITPTVTALQREWFDTKRQHAVRDMKRHDLTQHSGSKKKKPVVLVFFVGGVTRSEISCLRFVGRNAGMNVGVDFVIGSTKITNGFSVIDSLIDDQRVFDVLDREALRAEGEDDVGAAY
tara:strand:- start:30906 stop:33371 length:2466 start_codon:yes stop_codon:yes gene_type:complete